MSSEDEVTDNIPAPATRPATSGPAVTVKHGGDTSSGHLQAVSGDEITVLTASPVTMDTQVEISGPDGLSGAGVVIWTREQDGRHAIGIEVLGGAAEWSSLV